MRQINTLASNVKWGASYGSPQITISLAYEYQRVGADMQYRVQITINSLTGQRYFGYPVYSEVKLDGISKDSHTIKNASPSQWSSALTYTTGWLTAAGKTTGTTALAIRLYSGMGSSRTETFSYSVAVSPAASAVSAASCEIGGTSTISVTRYSTNFTHTITYTFGAASGTIATKSTAASFTWTAPDELAKQIPSAASGSCKITCTTYSGNTVIGSQTAAITLTVPASVVPTIDSVTIADTDSGIAEKFGVFVQNRSSLSVITVGSGASGSKIQTISVSADGKTYTGTSVTTDVLRTAGSLSVTTTATDTRGRTATSTQTITVSAYTVPTVTTFTCSRSLADGTENVEGTYLRSVLNYSISDVDGLNTALCVVQYKKDSESSWTNSDSFNDFVKNETITSTAAVLDADFPYKTRLLVKDYFETVTFYGDDIATAFTLVDYDASGKGVALGKVSEGEGLDIALTPIKIDGNTLADYVIEQGTSDGWTYRKWASGALDLFYAGYVTFPTSGSSSGITGLSVTSVKLTPPVLPTSQECAAAASCAWYTTEWLQADVTNADGEGVQIRLRKFCNATSLANASNYVNIICHGKWQ